MAMGDQMRGAEVGAVLVVGADCGDRRLVGGPIECHDGDGDAGQVREVLA